MHRLILGLICCFISVFHINHALAASYAVVPFQINGSASYAYLSKAIPSMLSSRLFVSQKNEPVKGQDSLIDRKPLTNETEAQKLRESIQADFLIYGSITVIGTQASLDVSVVSANKVFWQKSFQTPVNDLLTSVQNATKSINTEVFAKKTAVKKQEKETNTRSTQNNVAGDVEQRSRSKLLDFESLGIETADFNNDGQMEIAILKSNYINIYRYENQAFTLLTESKIPNNLSPIRVRAFTYKDTVYTILSTHNKASNKPSSMIYRYKNNELELIDRVPYYLNVATPTVHDVPMILGQQGEATQFLRGYIFEVNFDGNKLIRSRNFSQLPKEANLYNFTWLQGTEKQDGNHLIVINDEDRMLTFDNKGKRVAKSQEYYASGGISVPVSRDITGFQSKEGQEHLRYYYVPIRCIPIDLNKDGEYELLATKPVGSMASILNSYRTYTQGDIRSLVWDGLGMSSLWQTRKIKGTIVDINLADPDNDGVIDLVVNVNTHTGTLGLGQIRNMILLYPLGPGA